ncbi:MAG: N-acyl-D-amino-acid deacylase, partial [Chloroflexota bacterium]|nr:N-acyl-D-amino-acid deacylase [Chloroflexota bacterium]
MARAHAATGTIAAMPFDLLIRGGILVDGTGTPGRPADVGVTGDRITAVGDLSMVPDTDAATVITAEGHVVAPGFVDPHNHSDASVLVDGALPSHLRQGYTTLVSGNCGYTLAPLTPPAR